MLSSSSAPVWTHSLQSPALLSCPADCLSLLHLSPLAGGRSQQEPGARGQQEAEQEGQETAGHLNTGGIEVWGLEIDGKAKNDDGDRKVLDIFSGVHLSSSCLDQTAKAAVPGLGLVDMVQHLPLLVVVDSGEWW